MLKFMGLQRVGQDLATEEQQQIEHLKFQLFFSLTHELFRSGFLSHTCLGKVI